MLVTERTYEEIALGEPERRWELHDGELREKPGMSLGHNDVLDDLYRALSDQIDRTAFKVSGSGARLRAGDDIVYIPDLIVIPLAYRAALRDRRHRLEVHDQPMPLVVEVWSPSTGAYDIDTKIPTYRARGDAEIWRLHPFERTLTAWRKRLDGTYEETVLTTGVVEPVMLPGVRIDLDALFA